MCECFDQYGNGVQPSVSFHPERQDTAAPGWQHLLTLIDEAVADGREVFKPLVELTAAERRQVITLPPGIAQLKAVRHLVLYRSNLVRLPPEIGEMESLEQFSPYTSHRLHWFPYELTRCANLRYSTVSTRSIYGNYKFRPQFPLLRGPEPEVTGPDAGQLDPAAWGADAIRSCSVCDAAIPPSGYHQVWISLRLATDALPLLVNACSQACVEALPQPHANYVATPHRGGPNVTQPPTRH